MLTRLTQLAPAMACVLALSACSPERAPQSQPTSRPAVSQSASRPAVSQPTSGPVVSEGLVLAVTTAGAFRVRDLLPYVKALSSSGKAEENTQSLERHPPRTLAAMARAYIYEGEIAREYRERRPALPAPLDDTIAANRATETREYLVRQIKAEIGEITTDTARAYYDNNKIEFTVPFSFSMRHLSLTAYVPYVAQPGDTLELIAGKISGSPAAVEGILTDTVGKLPRWAPPQDRSRRPFIPLQLGERLLVPMSVADRATAREILRDKILPQLQEGKDFAALCERYSEAEDKGRVIGPLPFGTSPMLPEILEAARTLPINQVSDIIETRHGFEVLQITSRTDERLKPFAEVGAQIRRDLFDKELKKRSQLRDIDIWRNAQIDYKTALDPDAPSSDTVVKTRRRMWTKGELMRSPIAGELKQAVSVSQVNEAVQRDPEVYREILFEYAEQTGVYEDRDLAPRLAIQTDRFTAEWALEEAAREATAQPPSGEQTRAWYDAHIERFTPPKRYRVRQIVVTLDPAANLEDPAQRRTAEEKAFAQMRQAVRGVKTQEDFIEAAKKASQEPRTAEQGGYVGEILAEERPGKYAEVLASLAPRTPSEPFLYGRLAVVLWIDEVVSPPPTALDAARPGIVAEIEAETKARVRAQMIEDALARVGYQAAF